MHSAKPLTVHIRLTKACNADCSYCSSWQGSPDARMSPAELRRALEFVLSTCWDALGVRPTHITAQFVGGEISSIPLAELKEHVQVVEQVCAQHGMSVIAGAQSNLILTERKAVQLYDLFSGRLGTSIDLESDKRTVAGDAERYRVIWKTSDSYLRKRRSPPGAIFVVEPGGAPAAKRHMLEAARSARALTLRPVFTGGIKTVTVNSGPDFASVFTELFDTWFMRLPIIVEPFFQLLESRLTELESSTAASNSSCAFQSDCTQKSINIDPNGDLHVCLEMADAGFPAIGNALRGEWFHDAISVYSSRKENLSQDCIDCPYLASCRGGCMYESIAQGHGVHGKSDYCSTWKAIFGRIDTALQEYGVDAVREWALRLATRHENLRCEGVAKSILQA
ncbi:hypothetical protein LCGC14_0236950 [marine sediment metagenome]|uniref:Radical SAM core domain-containing protein n=1 Tax=marine sediment metagenome TaxID=412755 RepID=A0A0F9XCT1_9ZZZZ